MNRSILVLGPHRSGTSAFTRVLNLLGVDLGSEMLKPQFDNTRGYWEHRAVFDLHERLLSRAGSAWHNTLPMPLGWRDLEEVDALTEELRTLLLREFGDSPLWGVKDPRLCRLLPLWLDVLEELEVETRCVIVVRNPLEVAHSLERRNRFTFNKCLLLYLAEMIAAIRHSEGRSRAFVSYDMLLEDWREAVAGLTSELEVAWPVDPAERAAEIDAFLEPSNRHHRATVDDLRREPTLPRWATDLYLALEEACRGRHDNLDAAFREAERSFREATALFGPELESLRSEADRLSGRLQALEQTDAEKARERQERRAEIAERELSKLQDHLTTILSSRFYRSTRALRRTWGRFARLRH